MGTCKKAWCYVQSPGYIPFGGKRGAAPDVLAKRKVLLFPKTPQRHHPALHSHSPTIVHLLDLQKMHKLVSFFPNQPHHVYVRNGLQVRTYNLREVKPLRNLDPQHIDQMVALRGMVIRTSQIIPDLKQAFFRCIVCNASKEVGCSCTCRYSIRTSIVGYDTTEQEHQQYELEILIGADLPVPLGFR